MSKFNYVHAGDADSGRGGPHVGERHAEFNMMREALGAASLIGAGVAVEKGDATKMNSHPQILPRLSRSPFSRIPRARRRMGGAAPVES
jgi:hypothetical protein